MFTEFIYRLRRHGLPVGVSETLTLARAMSAGLHDSSLDGFYFLARSVLVHHEGHLDAFDQAFAEEFRGAAEVPIEVDDELRAWLAEAAAEAFDRESNDWVDSKDMDHAIWQRLAQRAAHHLARPDVAGVVVTHGTDTLEETAWFLHRVLAPAKPLVLTAAMRPATALGADGPQNLLDAVRVAREPGAHGAVVVLAGSVHGAPDVRKVHPYRTDAFDSGDAGALARVEEGRLRVLRAWPAGEALGLGAIAADAAGWPWVAVVPSHAGARGEAVDALVAAGVRGEAR